MRHETRRQQPAPSGLGTVVELEDVVVGVRREETVDATGVTRFRAELRVIGAEHERAVVEALTGEALDQLLAVAVPAFAASVRLRWKRRA